MHRLYLWACKKWAPGGLTLSANAFRHFLRTGDSWRRDRIDGFFLLAVGQRDHCQTQFQRETRANPEQ